MKLALALFALAASSAASADDGTWRSGEPLAEPRAGLEAVTIDKTIYVVGGSGLLAPSSNFEAYVPELGTWDTLTPLPRGRARFGVAVINGRIVVAGGDREVRGVDGVQTETVEKESTASVISYDAGKASWVELEPLLTPRKGLTLTTLDGALYAVGGGQAVLDIYDPNFRIWIRQSAPAETARADGAAAAVGGKLYFIGGKMDDVAVARVDVYDPATKTWARGPDLPQARAGAAAVVFGGALHVLGGSDADDVAQADHWVLNGAGDAWTDGVALPAPRADFAAAAVEGRLVVLGGGGRGGFYGPFTTFDAVDVFEAD